MPILPLISFVGQVALTPKVVVDRFAAYMKAHPVMQVRVAITGSAPGLQGSGVILLNRPKVKADVITKGGGYYLVLNGENGIEALPGDESYADFDTADNLDNIPFRLIDEVNDLNISPIVFGSMNHGPSWQKVEKGALGDVIKMHAEGDLGSIDYEAEVDAEGKLVRVKVTRGARGKVSSWAESAFSGYLPTIPSTELFSIDPKTGWTAAGLRLPAMPLQQSESPADQAVLTPDGKADTFKQMLNGRTLVAVLDTDWARSEWGAEVLTRVQKQFSDAKVSFVKLTDTPGQKEAGFWTDPTGKLLRSLAPQGSPTFYLFKEDGKLQQAFFTVSPREPEVLYKDIATALSQSAEK